MVKIEFFRIIVELNNILAEWDPIGSQLVDLRWRYSEYIDYISKIIDAYLSGIALNDLLIDFNLSMGLNETNIVSIEKAANQIQYLLSSFDKKQLEIMFNSLSD